MSWRVALMWGTVRTDLLQLELNRKKNAPRQPINAHPLFHTVLNVGRLVSYPTIGSHYDPADQAVGYLIAFIIAAIVVFVWGPKTLTGR